MSDPKRRAGARAADPPREQMIDVEGRTVVFIGRLSRLPRRVAARCVSDLGGMPRRSLTRATDYAVVGRDSAWLAGNRLKAKLATARHLGAVCLGEGDFLRGLGLLPPLRKEGRTLTLDDLAHAGGLDRDTLGLFVLLDILECEGGRFAFSSLGIARTAARLLSEGTPLVVVCRGLLAAAHGHRQNAAALVRRADGTIGVRWGDQVADLSGQLRLPLPEPGFLSVDDLFEAAELAEDAGDLARAERLYRQCVELDRISRRRLQPRQPAARSGQAQRGQAVLVPGYRDRAGVCRRLVQPGALTRCRRPLARGREGLRTCPRSRPEVRGCAVQCRHASLPAGAIPRGRGSMGAIPGGRSARRLGEKGEKRPRLLPKNRSARNAKRVTSRAAAARPLHRA
jgi:hypothetical protein